VQIVFGRCELASKDSQKPLSLDEAQAKRRELVKDLLQYRLSLDPSSVQSHGGPGAVQRKLRAVDLQIAVLKQGK